MDKKNIEKRPVVSDKSKLTILLRKEYINMPV